jgi:hypothetical protein
MANVNSVSNYCSRLTYIMVTQKRKRVKQTLPLLKVHIYVPKSLTFLYNPEYIKNRTLLDAVNH